MLVERWQVQLVLKTRPGSKANKAVPNFFLLRAVPPGPECEAKTMQQFHLSSVHQRLTTFLSAVFQAPGSSPSQGWIPHVVFGGHHLEVEYIYTDTCTRTIYVCVYIYIYIHACAFSLHGSTLTGHHELYMNLKLLSICPFTYQAVVQTRGSSRAHGHTEGGHDRIRVHVNEQPRRYTTSCKQGCQVQSANLEGQFELAFREVRATHLLRSRSRYRSQSSMMFSNASRWPGTYWLENPLLYEAPEPEKPLQGCRDMLRSIQNLEPRARWDPAAVVAAPLRIEFRASAIATGPSP